MSAFPKRKAKDGGKIVAAGYFTTTRDMNIAGRTSCYLLANDLKAKINVHIASYGASTGEHKALHSAAVISSPDATTVATLLTLTNELTTKYALHNTDAIAGSPTYHIAQDTTHALASAAVQTLLSGCITQLNDIKTKYNLHVAETTAHRVGGVGATVVADSALGVAIQYDDSRVLAGDAVVFAILNDGTGNVTGVSAIGVNGGSSFTFSAEPQTDTIVSYCTIRGA
jgi:uncharacterized protein YlxP (DUF503 family)